MECRNTECAEPERPDIVTHKQNDALSDEEMNKLYLGECTLEDLDPISVTYTLFGEKNLSQQDHALLITLLLKFDSKAPDHDSLEYKKISAKPDVKLDNTLY